MDDSNTMTSGASTPPKDAAQDAIDASPLQRCELGNGETLTYREYNSKKFNTTPHVLLIIGGYACDNTSLADFVTMTEFSDHHLVFVDPRGFGDSTYNSPVESHEEFATDIKLFIDQVLKEEEPIMVMGYSTGGAIATTLTLLYPDSISACFLLDSVPLNGFKMFMLTSEGFPEDPVRYATTFDDVQEHVGQLERMGLHSDDLQVIRAVWGGAFHSDFAEDSPLWCRIQKAAIKHRSRVAANWSNIKHNVTPTKALVSGPSHALKHLRCPLVAIHGENDNIIPLSQVKAITDEMQKARSTWASEMGGSLSLYTHSSGHYPMWEALEEVSKLYRRALEEQVLQTTKTQVKL